MRKSNIRLFALIAGTCFAIFASAVRPSAKQYFGEARAEEPETSLVSSAGEASQTEPEPAKSESAPATSQEGGIIPVDPVIPDEKWASFEAKAKEIIAKAIAIAGAVGSIALIALKFITWLADRGLIKKNNQSAQLIMQGCQSIADTSAKFQADMAVAVDKVKSEINDVVAEVKDGVTYVFNDTKAIFEEGKQEIMELKQETERALAESKEQLMLAKKEISDLKNVLTVMLQHDPAMIAAGAYKQALPYLDKGVIADGEGQ